MVSQMTDPFRVDDAIKKNVKKWQEDFLLEQILIKKSQEWVSCNFNALHIQPSQLLPTLSPPLTKKDFENTK